MNTYIEIDLGGGLTTKVNTEDYGAVMAAGPWFAFDSKGTGEHVYAVRRAPKGEPWRLHRFLLGLTDRSVQGDHINGDTLDNRRENLRPATAKENGRNARRRSDNTTGFKGVQRVNGSFVARVQREEKYPDGRRKVYDFYREVFSDLDSAVAAYDDAVRNLHGEFARLNRPRVGERGLDGSVREA